MNNKILRLIKKLNEFDNKFFYVKWESFNGVSKSVMYCLEIHENGLLKEDYETEDEQQFIDTLMNTLAHKVLGVD